MRHSTQGVKYCGTYIRFKSDKLPAPTSLASIAAWRVNRCANGGLRVARG